MLKKPFSFWQNAVFTDETSVPISFIIINISTISKGTVRRILKKYVVFAKNASKKSVSRRKASVFVQNGLSICSRSLSLSDRMPFLLMKQVCPSPATALLEFFEEIERDFLKKNKKFEFGRTTTYVLGCYTIKWTKIAS